MLAADSYKKPRFDHIDHGFLADLRSGVDGQRDAAICGALDEIILRDVRRRRLETV